MNTRHPLLEEMSSLRNPFRLLSDETAKGGSKMAKRRYFRHRVGVNKTKMVKTSSRPSSMAAEQTQVWKLLNTP